MTGSGKYLNYTSGTSEGSVYSSNSYLEFLEGKGLEYPFGNDFTPRIWNGIINYCPETSTSTEAFTVEGPKDLRIHPNPSDGRLRVSFTSRQDAEMIVRDLQGRVVHRRGQLAGRDRQQVEMDLSQLSDGLYHLTLLSDKGSVSKKLIIR